MQYYGKKSPQNNYMTKTSTSGSISKRNEIKILGQYLRVCIYYSSVHNIKVLMLSISMFKVSN